MLENSSASFSSYDWSHFQLCRSLFMAYFCCSILYLPLLLLVLLVAFQRWRNRRSGASSERTSHFDVITFNIVSLELIWILGCSWYCYGMFTGHPLSLFLGVHLWFVVFPVQNLFHILACVDRYLAVVHPVTYLGLRGGAVLRIRNIGIGCFWLFSFVYPGLLAQLEFADFISLVFLFLSSVIAVFCSLAVLFTLIRPGPGEAGGNRERVDQSKRRALNSIVAITGALFLRFLSIFVFTLVKAVLQVGDVSVCVMTWSFTLFVIPSGLVLPVLFLQRAGKLPTLR